VRAPIRKYARSQRSNANRLRQIVSSEQASGVAASPRTAQATS
jgi:hypothetical protein